MNVEHMEQQLKEISGRSNLLKDIEIRVYPSLFTYWVVILLYQGQAYTCKYSYFIF